MRRARRSFKHTLIVESKARWTPLALARCGAAPDPVIDAALRRRLRGLAVKSFIVDKVSDTDRKRKSGTAEGVTKRYPLALLLPGEPDLFVWLRLPAG